MAVRIINRSMSIPIPDRVIGHVGDNLVETRSFELNRYYGEVDLSEFSFKLDTEIDGNKNIIDLDKTVEDDKITLIWTVHASHVLHAGRMTIQLRAFHDDIEKWHSAQDYVIIQDSIKAPDAYSSLLPSEFEQMELRVTTLKEQAQEAAQTAEQQADRAQGIADTFENTTLPAAIQSVEQAVEEQIGIAKSHADRAQGIADTFSNTTLPAAISAVEAAGQAKVDLAEAQAIIATTKAQEASDSAAAALASEQATKTSEDNAAGHAGTATEQADRAQDIADTFENETLPAAITAVEAAGQAKVDLAEQQANIAAGHAQTAATKAEETSGYVNDAFEYKEAAEGAASIATEKAWEAANSAQIAEQQAGIAATKATEAYDSAERAKMSEEAVEGVADEHRLKIAKLEKELNDYKATMQQINPNQEATQSVSGYGIVSLPQNAANGQVSCVIKGNTVQNILPDIVAECQSTSGWGAYQTSVTTDSDNKYSGTHCLKIMLNAGYNVGALNRSVLPLIDKNKYYMFSAYVKNGNLSGDGIRASLACVGDVVEIPGTNITSTNYTRTAVLLKPSDMDTATDVRLFIYLNGAENEYAFIDAIMLNEITAEEYALGASALLQKYNWHLGTKSTVSAIRLTSKNEDETEQSTQYITAKDEEGKIAELRSLPNGTKDEVNVTSGIKTQRTKEYILQASDIRSIQTNPANVDHVQIKKPTDFKYYNSVLWEGDKAFKLGSYKTFVSGSGFDNANNINSVSSSASIFYFYLIIEKGTYADLAAARAALAGTTLTYQLAEPVEIPIEVSGTLLSHPSGTVYIEPVVADAGIYTDKMTVLHQDLPIKALEKLSKIDFMTGLETELDVSDAVIAEDKLSFTHPELTEGDIVFFVYEHDKEGTTAEAEIEFYDSRFVVKDDVTEKFYKWHIAVADGVPSIELVEV